MKIESITELRLVVEAARQGSLTLAGRSLKLTPAGASAALKSLERRLDTRLFERSTRALRLTAEGRVILDYSQRALDLLAEAESQVSERAEQLSGLISVTAPSDLTRGVLLPWFDTFLEHHPCVSLALTVSDSLRDVVRDEVDVALRYGILSDSHLVARLLSFARRVACASPGYLRAHGRPKHPRELVEHECLTFSIGSRRHTLWHFARDGESVDVRVSGRRVADDAHVAHQWALRGHGIVYKSEIDLRSSFARRELVPLFPDYLGEPCPLHAVLPSKRFVPARVRALVDFLVEQFAALNGTSKNRR
jgi:DNA-binding transcriptional LysR family regulator